MNFTIKITREMFFTLVVRAFSAVAYWTTKINIKAIYLLAESKLLRRFASSINIKSIIFQNILTKLIRRFANDIYIKPISLIGVMKNLYKQSHEIYIYSLTISSNISRRFPISNSTNLQLKSITLSGTLLSGTFRALSSLDASALSVLDSETLGDLDLV
jgi:hypothetical protein